MYSPAPTGRPSQAILPQRNADGEEEMLVTALTAGGSKWNGLAILLVHVLFWAASIGMAVATTVALSNATAPEANAQAVPTSGTLCGIEVFTVLLILMHAGFAVREERGAIAVSVLLVAFLGLSCGLATLVAAYGLILGNQAVLTLSLASMVCVVISASMAFTFFIEWSHRGNLAMAWQNLSRVAPAPQVPEDL